MKETPLTAVFENSVYVVWRDTTWTSNDGLSNDVIIYTEERCRCTLIVGLWADG